MRRILKNIATILLLVTLVWCGGIWAEREYLRKEVLRLQIITTTCTDTWEQAQHIQNTVLNYLSKIQDSNANTETFSADLQKYLAQATNLNDCAVKNTGSPENFIVTFERKPYIRNVSNSDVLPSGVYHSLQIVLVNHSYTKDSSPVLYSAATERHIYDSILDLNTRNNLYCALTDGQNTPIRFLFLEYLGRLENILFSI